MKSYPNVNPTDAEMVILKTEKGTWGLYLKGELWGEYKTFKEAVSTYSTLCVEE